MLVCGTGWEKKKEKLLSLFDEVSPEVFIGKF